MFTYLKKVFPIFARLFKQIPKVRTATVALTMTPRPNDSLSTLLVILVSFLGSTWKRWKREIGQGGGRETSRGCVTAQHGRSELDAKVAHHHCQFVGCAPWSQNCHHKANNLT